MTAAPVPARGAAPRLVPPARLSTAPVLNLPNSLTLARLVVVPVFALLLLTAGAEADVRVLLWALFTAACLTDVVDGRLARRWGQVTGFGVLADPIADKALVATALVGLSLLGELPWLATAVVLGRELAVTLLRLWVARHGLIPASRGGKAKAFSQDVAVALYLLPLGGLLADLRTPVLLLAVVATVVTGLDYLAQALRLRAAARS